VGSVDEKPDNLETLGAQFLKGYYYFKNEFPESPQAWTIDSKCTEIFNNDSLMSFLVRTIAYTGGAHPNQTARYVTYLKRNQGELTLEDLSLDTQLLREALTDAFRIARKLDPAQPLSEAGLFVEDRVLPINGNFAVVKKGLLFHYDPYEIGPYSMGAIDVEVPWEALKPIVHK
jgi:hypothetical protein